MKSLLKLLVIVLSLVIGNQNTLAQESKDYYKFDDNGYLCEFLLTTPDGVQIQYKYHEGANDNKGIIIYPDGTQVDFTTQLCTSFNPEPLVWPSRKVYDTYGAIPVKQWYKDIKTASAAPKLSEMLDNLFALREVTIIFKDNSQVTINYGTGTENDRTEIKGYVDVSDSGDQLSISRDGYINIINLKEPKIIDKDSRAVKSTARLAYGVKIPQNWSGILEGQVVTDEGTTFTGTFSVLFNGERQQFIPKSPYLRELLNGRTEDKSIMLPFYGYDNIIGISLCDGTVVNKDNKIIAMYEYYRQLDEFDMASKLAAEQGRIDREKAAAKQAASEKAAIANKYGKKYADAFFAGKVIVGMPWKLVEIGLNAHSFKSFYTAFLSYERQSAYGTKQCYSLIGDNLAYVGHIWVTNGVVETVIYY